MASAATASVSVVAELCAAPFEVVGISSVPVFVIALSVTVPGSSSTF